MKLKTMSSKLNAEIFLILASQVICSNSIYQFTGEILKFKLSATNLPNSDLDFDGISDPYAVLFTSVQVQDVKHWSKFGQTAVKKDTVSPQWDEVFMYQYIQGTNQTWRIFVIDKDRTWYNPVDDPLGHVEVAVDDYRREIRSVGGNGTLFKPVQLFLTRPLGGVLTMTPVNE